MLGENDKHVDVVDPQLDTSCRLENLCNRSQLDFEIEFFERILSRDPNYLEVLVNLGELFSRKGCHRRALQVDLRLVQLKPACASTRYNLACSYALLDRKSDALEALQQAVDLGYADIDFMLADPDLARLQALPGFQWLISRIAGRDGTQHVI